MSKCCDFYQSISVTKLLTKQITPTFQNFVCSNALFYMRKNIFDFFSTQIFALKVDGAIETIFYLAQDASLSHWVKFQSDHTHFLKLCLLKCVTLTNNIFEFLSPQIFEIKTNESIKTIFYLLHYVYMLK